MATVREVKEEQEEARSEKTAETDDQHGQPSGSGDSNIMEEEEEEEEEEEDDDDDDDEGVNGDVADTDLDLLMNLILIVCNRFGNISSTLISFVYDGATIVHVNDCIFTSDDLIRIIVSASICMSEK